MAEPETKKTKLTMDSVIEQLKIKTKYEKNKYLDSLDSVDLLGMKLQLEKEILDMEYHIKKHQMELALIKSKRKLFDYYDDGIDPY